MARGFQLTPGANAEMREAQNPELTKSELLPLGASRSTAVRIIVAARQDCPLGLMVTLAHDYHVDVRCAIASNPSAQRSVLAYLAADRHIEVVKAVLSNPSLPTDILDELAFHKKAAVREAATRRLDSDNAQARAEQQRDSVFEDSRVPEVAEKGDVAPDRAIMSGAPRAKEEFTFAPVEEPGRQPSEAAEDPDVAMQAEPEVYVPVVSDPEQPNPRWTRTAPVRGFRPPRAQED
jgi:hypothetical protein